MPHAAGVEGIWFTAMKALINLDTLRRNPDEGATTSHITGLATITRKSQWHYADGWHYTEEQYIKDQWVMLHHSRQPEPLKNGGVWAEIDQHEDFIEICHAPKPKWLYEYVYPEHNCTACGKLVPIGSICPNCDCEGEEIDHETVEEALKRAEWRGGL
jgi:hypothetical protein